MRIGKALSAFLLLALVIYLPSFGRCDEAPSANVIFVHALVGAPSIVVYYDEVMITAGMGYGNSMNSFHTNVTSNSSINIKVATDEVHPITLISDFELNVAQDSFVIVTLVRRNATSVKLAVNTYPVTTNATEGALVYFIHNALGFQPIDFFIYTSKVAGNMIFGETKTQEIPADMVNFSVYRNGYQKAATELIDMTSQSATLIMLIGETDDPRLLIIALVAGPTATASSAPTLRSSVFSFLHSLCL